MLCLLNVPWLGGSLVLWLSIVMEHGAGYELAAKRQVANKEARRSAYVAERARPYPQAKDRITPYVETPHQELALPAALPPPPPPTHPRRAAQCNQSHPCLHCLRTPWNPEATCAAVRCGTEGPPQAGARRPCPPHNGHQQKINPSMGRLYVCRLFDTP